MVQFSKIMSVSDHEKKSKFRFTAKFLSREHSAVCKMDIELLSIYSSLIKSQLNPELFNYAIRCLTNVRYMLAIKMQTEDSQFFMYSIGHQWIEVCSVFYKLQLYRARRIAVKSQNVVLMYSLHLQRYWKSVPEIDFKSFYETDKLFGTSTV